MERLDEARTTAACGQNPQHAAPPTGHNHYPPEAPRFHHPKHQESRESTRAQREPRGWVRSTTNRARGYHSELTQSTKTRACAGEADVGAVLKQRRWVPRGRGSPVAS